MMTAGQFANDFVPKWIEVVRDHELGGVVERLDDAGQPVHGEAKTTLVHARTVFSLAHLHLLTGNEALLAAAGDVYRCMAEQLRLPNGGYRYSVQAAGNVGDEAGGSICRAYDQSFVLLALVTLRQADPALVATEEIDGLWRFIQTITDPATGALFEDDVMARAGARPGDTRAQNPQMHMLEALLQAYELTGDRQWLERASDYVVLAERFFVDADTGAVREFVAHDLSPLQDAAGQRREPGHQYEWAWLLLRYVELGGDERVRPLAERMLAFADMHGFRRCGEPMDGAPYDAVDNRGNVVEATHLLWPLTEAGKLAALLHLHGAPSAGDRAREIERLIFGAYFHPTDIRWVNQLDGSGAVLWSDGLSRMIYHVLLFVTEGARAGLWEIKRNLQ